MPGIRRGRAGWGRPGRLGGVAGGTGTPGHGEKWPGDAGAEWPGDAGAEWPGDTGGGVAWAT